MNWIKLETDIFSTPEYILAEPTDRATWMALLIFCAKNENKGIIVNCLNWKDRTWQQLAAVTLAEVNRSSTLIEWEGCHLKVKFYPSDTEELLKTKREASAKGHQAKAAKTAIVAMPQSQNWQCHNEDSGNATLPAKIEVLAMQSRVEKSRIEKSRIDQRHEASDEDGKVDEWIGKEHREFTAWFTNYPKQIGEIEAQREWTACSSQRPPAQEMISILGQHLNSREWQEEGGKYIPRASAYLNGQRWRDKLTPGKPIPKPRPPKPEIHVDEPQAFTWRKKHYPMSIDRSGGMTEYPFRQWPSEVQEEYLKTL